MTETDIFGAIVRRRHVQHMRKHLSENKSKRKWKIYHLYKYDKRRDK